MIDSSGLGTPTKRAMAGDEASAKRARHTSLGTDDEIQQNVREDHQANRFPSSDLGHDTGFGDDPFGPYNPLPSIPPIDLPGPHASTPVVPLKRQRVPIIEDTHTSHEEESRSWTENYHAHQKRRKLRNDQARIAKRNAENMVWSWGGVVGEKLPGGLEMFGKEGLKRRWGQMKEERERGDGGARKGSREGRLGGGGGDGEVEMGTGFGDIGGFDTIDYSVPRPPFQPAAPHLKPL